jgi:hypothetical protein
MASTSFLILLPIPFYVEDLMIIADHIRKKRSFHPIAPNNNNMCNFTNSVRLADVQFLSIHYLSSISEMKQQPWLTFLLKML